MNREYFGFVYLDIRRSYLNTYMYCLLYFPRNNSLCIQYTFRSFYKMVATNKIERYLVKINLINVAKT